MSNVELMYRVNTKNSWSRQSKYSLKEVQRSTLSVDPFKPLQFCLPVDVKDNDEEFRTVADLWTRNPHTFRVCNFNKNPVMHKQIHDETRHPVFWFDDGSMVIRVENQAFKVHRTLLSRHSRFFAGVDPINLDSGSDLTLESCILLDQGRNVRAKDLEVLLEHFYHDASLLSEVQFSRLAAALRVSSPQQLDFPAIHAHTRRRLISIIPPEYSPEFLPDDPEEALALATEYEIPSMRKALYYYFVTSPGSQFDASSGAAESPDDHSPPPSVSETGTASAAPSRPLSPADAKLCTQLMEQIINHFTPILFTPPATPHMACTDVFADTWMPLVIQPAIEDDGVYKPLETLERIKNIDWGKAGLCAACVKEKAEEWSEEQQNIWTMMDTWVGLVST